MKLPIYFFSMLIFSTTAYVSTAFASDCQKHYKEVANDLNIFDSKISKMISDFEKIPTDVLNKDWVKSKLQNMYDIDQYTRNYAQTPHQQSYSIDETKCFAEAFNERFYSIDMKCTTDLKSLLKTYEWFKISKFGELADSQAWLIVQHADLDLNFQIRVLKILEKLWPIKETSPANYAYLFDRVAVSWNDPSKRKPQRFGTQGQCQGSNNWQPVEIEDPINLDNRRREFGLSPYADYKKIMDAYCL
jgi:hypothetical protein